jgi:tripartite-type tricarboxylate transporter receptor subunit TctC
MNGFSRGLAAAGVAALVGIGASAAAAEEQTYPVRTITMIVPFAAGGPTDVVARIITAHMARTLGQNVVIENVVGAGVTTAIR